MKELDQGTILFGLRSEKYPSTPCYGILITASCDISNDKVSKLYFLVGVDAKKWFFTEYAYSQVYESKIESLFKPVEKMCNDFLLDAESIRHFLPEEVGMTIGSALTQKTDRDKFNKIYQAYSVFCRPGMTDQDRRQVVKANQKPAKTFLLEISAGKRFHYFYLSKAAYLEESNKMDDGLIVDLQEIGALSLRDAKQIVGRGIDNLLLVGENEKECARLCSQFWLDGRDDFVGIEGKIHSPWREHLMQRFVHDFSRIGLDGPTEHDYENLVGNV